MQCFQTEMDDQVLLNKVLSCVDSSHDVQILFISFIFDKLQDLPFLQTLVQGMQTLKYVLRIRVYSV